MKQFSFSKVILIVLSLSLLYWTYLATHISMQIEHDSIGYQNLGHLLQQKGILAYIKAGPQREPAYPLLIALSMQLEHLTGVDYTKIMAFFGVLILLCTQWLLYKTMCLLNIHRMICAIILLYFGFSPAINNTAFSLYSEIGTYLLIFGVILISYRIYQSLENNKIKKSFWLSAFLGFLFMLLTLSKGVFECIAPLYLLILLLMANLASYKTQKRIGSYVICFLISSAFFYGPVLGYKSLNKALNGNFVITNRASMMIYGSAERRSKPLSSKEFLTALAYTPGEGFCKKYFSQQECDFWSFQKTDKLGIEKTTELALHYPSSEAINTALIHLSLKKDLENPAQFIFLTTLEGLKMFFWESTKIGFVTYPNWLENIYNHPLFKDILRFIVSLMSFLAFFYCFYLALKTKDALLTCLLALTTIYILCFSFVCILTRYALPIAPLFLICIGYSVNQLLTHKENKT